MEGQYKGVIKALSFEGFVAREAPLPARYNRLWRWDMDSGLRALAKTPRKAYLGPKTDLALAGHEAATWLAAELLEWTDLVAPSCVRRWEEEDCWVSVQLLWPPSAQEQLSIVDRFTASNDGLRITALDYLIGNQDRNKSNVLVDGDRLRAIDHEMAFRRTHQGGGMTTYLCEDNQGTPIPGEIHRALERLLESDLSDIESLIGDRATTRMTWRAQALLRSAAFPGPISLQDLPAGL